MNSFRMLFSDFAGEPVIFLSPSARLLYYDLLFTAAADGSVDGHINRSVKGLSIILRRDVAGDVDELVDCGLVTLCDDVTLHVTGFDNRSFDDQKASKALSGADRTRAYRQRKNESKTIDCSSVASNVTMSDDVTLRDVTDTHSIVQYCSSNTTTTEHEGGMGEGDVTSIVTAVAGNLGCVDISSVATIVAMMPATMSDNVKRDAIEMLKPFDINACRSIMSVFNEQYHKTDIKMPVKYLAKLCILKRNGKLIESSNDDTVYDNGVAAEAKRNELCERVAARDREARLALPIPVDGPFAIKLKQKTG